MPVLCCYAKRRRASSITKSPEQCKRDVLGITLARLDEFENLTPLMVVSSDNENEISSLHRHQLAVISRSPPPPRCLINGKTLIVPLNSRKGCAPFLPLLASPDSNNTPFKNDVMKGCNTTVEDNENVPIFQNLDKFDADFISIDRTTASYLEPRQQKLQQCECDVLKQEKVPSFELPIPSYAPPPLPVLAVRSQRFSLRKELLIITGANNGTNSNSDEKSKKSPSINSVNSFGSPQDSSFSMGSPLDTSASISDSFCIVDEGEMNSKEEGEIRSLETGLQPRIDMQIYGFSPQLDCSICESDSQQKYVLHRIEEESEQNADIETAGMVTSRTLDSIKSTFSHSNQINSQCNIIVSHSISQQYVKSIQGFE
ncbi:ABC multidrug transporter atrB [Dirofilaria immitis]